MSDDRTITGIEVTDGARPDGLQLPALIENSKKNGVTVKEVVGDMAYVSDENLGVCEEQEVTLYARTNSAVAAAANTELEEGFSYSKDAHIEDYISQYNTVRPHMALGYETPAAVFAASFSASA